MTILEKMYTELAAIAEADRCQAISLTPAMREAVSKVLAEARGALRAHAPDPWLALADEVFAKAWNNPLDAEYDDL